MLLRAAIIERRAGAHEITLSRCSDRKHIQMT